MTLTNTLATASPNAQAPWLPVTIPAPRVPAGQGVSRADADTSYAVAVAQRHLQLQGRLDDLYSEYEDAAQAIAAGRGGRFYGALGALEARLASCAASITAVEAQLMALDGLPRRGPSPIQA